MNGYEISCRTCLIIFWNLPSMLSRPSILFVPVPYFDGMKPTIMSLGRRPEKARDDDGSGPDLDAGFRDLD